MGEAALVIGYSTLIVMRVQRPMTIWSAGFQCDRKSGGGDHIIDARAVGRSEFEQGRLACVAEHDLGVATGDAFVLDRNFRMALAAGATDQEFGQVERERQTADAAG